MTDTLKQINELVASFSQQRAELVTKLKAEFAGIFTEVFDKTDVGCFYWTQYTPYFSDGDPCEFGVGDFAVLTNPTPEERYWEDCHQYPDTKSIVLWKEYLETDAVPSTWMSHYPDDESMLRSYYKSTRRSYFEKTYGPKFKDIPYNELTSLAEKATLVQEVLKALKSIPEDIYEDLFGDHVSVTVNRTGIHIEDYDHD